MGNVVGGMKKYVAMKTDYGEATESISSGLQELGRAVKNIANHAAKLGGLGFETFISFLKRIAAFAAMEKKKLLLVLEKMSNLIGGNKNYLAMKKDYATANEYELISSDFKEFGRAVKNLENHAVKLGGLGFGASFLKYVAAFAAIYLLILDRTHREWNTHTSHLSPSSLLIPYIFLTLPSWLFGRLRGGVGKWIALVTVVLRLFFPRRFPDSSKLPEALILLIVVAPTPFVSIVRRGKIGIFISLTIGCYLLQEHIRASCGCRYCSKSSYSVAILLLILYPVWALWFG